LTSTFRKSIRLLTDPHQERLIKRSQVPFHSTVTPTSDTLCVTAGIEHVAHNSGAAFAVGDLLAITVCGVGCGCYCGSVGVLSECGRPGEGAEGGVPLCAPVVGASEDVLTAGGVRG
jgi:hypothetical protein